MTLNTDTDESVGSDGDVCACKPCDRSRDELRGHPRAAQHGLCPRTSALAQIYLSVLCCGTGAERDACGVYSSRQYADSHAWSRIRAAPAGPRQPGHVYVVVVSEGGDKTETKRNKSQRWFLGWFVVATLVATGCSPWRGCHPMRLYTYNESNASLWSVRGSGCVESVVALSKATIKRKVALKINLHVSSITG